MTRYQFGDIVIDTDTIEVIGPDGVRNIEPQVYNVLNYLIEQPGRLITKEELLDNVWGDRFVSESALTTRIKQARRALDDDGRTQWAIKTVHGRGYRFIAEDRLASKPKVQSQRTPVPLPDELRADTRQLFVGRDGELAEAIEAISRPLTDKSFGWVWLLGEPGIGKTRLSAEVADSAQQKGHRVLFGRNSEDLQIAHQPFIEAIRSAINQLTADQRPAYIAQLSSELAPILPGVFASSATPSPDESATESEALRYRLFEAIAGWLIHAATDQPLTLILDDVHWAAESTLQLLAHLQRRFDGAAVNFVLTARDTAPDSNPRVADLIANSQGKTNTTVVRLNGLSDTDAVKIVGSTVELSEVMKQTAGNPLLLQAVNPEDGSVDIESAVRRRLANLDATVQETLRAASILGLEFDLSVAAAATKQGELDVLDQLEQAIAARLIDDVGVDRFRFTHALVRSSLRSHLSSTRRSRLHRQIADAIFTMFGDRHSHLPALAFHSAEAAEADVELRPLAVQRLHQAAQQASDQFSYDEATNLLRRAIKLADINNAHLHATLTLKKGIAQTKSGANMSAVHTFEVAIDAARIADDPLLRIESALRYEDASWRPGNSGAQALVYLDEAAAVLEHLMSTETHGEITDELQARLGIGRLRSLAISGQAPRARKEFAAIRELVQRLGSPTLEASALNVYLSQVQFHEDPAMAAPLIERLAELQSNITDIDVAMHAAHVRLRYATIAGHFDDADELTQLMDILQNRQQSKFWNFIHTNHQAMQAFYSGDLAAAEALAERCLALADELPEEDGSGTYGLRMFMIRREQDQLVAIAPLVQHVLTANDEGGVWTPGLAMLLVETGAHEAAAKAIVEIKAASFVIPRDAMWSTVMVFLIETAVQLGDVSSCRLLRDQFSDLAGTNVTTGSGLLSFGSADRYLGMLSFTIGDLEEAETSLGTALEADSAGNSPLWANDSRLWLSRVRRSQGFGAEADAMLTVVARQAKIHRFARLERLATTEQN